MGELTRVNMACRAHGTTRAEKRPPQDTPPHLGEEGIRGLGAERFPAMPTPMKGALGGIADAPQPCIAADSRGGGPEDPFREDYTRLLFSLYIRETKVSAFVAPQSTWFGKGRRGHAFV